MAPHTRWDDLVVPHRVAIIPIFLDGDKVEGDVRRIAITLVYLGSADPFVVVVVVMVIMPLSKDVATR